MLVFEKKPTRGEHNLCAIINPKFDISHLFRVVFLKYISENGAKLSATLLTFQLPVRLLYYFSGQLVDQFVRELQGVIELMKV